MRLLSSVVTALLITMLAYLYGVPLVDRAVNRARTLPADAARIDPLRRVPVVDLHSDALLWNRRLLERNARGHVDLPRLREGGVVLQVFSATNSFPAGANYRRTPRSPDLIALVAACNHWPAAAWRSPLERALVQARDLRATTHASAGRLVLIERAADLAALSHAPSGPTGALLSIEGLHGFEGDLGAVDRLFDAGFRVFGLVHMSDTDIAGSAHGWHKGGLTTFGKRVVARIDSLGGIVDLAHASPATIADVLDTGTRRVMVSHTGVDGTCPGNRNLSDEELSRVAASGGIVGIGFWKGAVCGSDCAAIARALRHAADVIGVERVALGSDFDGAVTTPIDASRLPQLIPALAAEGFSESEIAAIMGGNALWFFAQTLPRD